MKILLLSPLPPPSGGIASWTKVYLHTPQAKENEVNIVNTAIIGRRAGQLNKLRIVDEFQRTINILKSLEKQLRYNCPDIVHLNTPCSKLGLMRDYLCAKMIKNRGVKLLVHCRCDVTYMVNNKLGEFFFKKLMGISDCIIVLNTSSKTYIKDICSKDSEIIPNFVSENILTEISSEYNINTSITNVIYAGHITKLKGCDMILKVAEHFPNIRFTLAGYISEEIAQLKKTANVVFTGEISKEQVIEEMKKSDLFFFPSLTEGFPNALLEAMACGLPVITTDVGAIPDMIENQGGIIVKPGDLEGYIEGFNLLINDKMKRERMYFWNKHKINSAYREQIVMNSIFEKYKKLLH